MPARVNIEAAGLAANPDALGLLNAQLMHGMALDVCDETQPGLLRVLEDAGRIDWHGYAYTAEERIAFFGASSGAQGETARADAGLVPEPVSAAPAAPIIPTAPERVDWRALSDAERDALVLAAPADGLRGWLSSRGIAPPDFYRHRAAMAQRDAA